MSDDTLDEQLAIERERLRQERVAFEEKQRREEAELDTRLATKACLYIGGCADGVWVYTDTRRETVAYDQANLPSITSFSPYDTKLVSATMTMTRHHYRRMEWCCSPYDSPHKTFKTSEARRFYMYVLQGMSDAQAINMLIRGYCAPDKRPD